MISLNYMDVALRKQNTDISSYKGCHSQDTIVVCGCGKSLARFSHPARFVTIGVNDVERLFTPDYLVVLNPASQFKDDRFRYVEKSRARAIFTQLNLRITNRNVVRIKLGKRGGTELDSQYCVPFTRNSPYVALCLAMFMGAKRIGVIGVDFTDHHFFSKTGAHVLSKNMSKIDQEYTNLYESAQKNGIEIVNLSEESRLTAFPKQNIEEFYSGRRLQKNEEITEYSRLENSLNIVSYSMTPVAGVPELLARCINESTHHNAVCVWQDNKYGNGVSFNSAVEWKNKPELAKSLLLKADLVIVHNGKILSQHRKYVKNKPVLTLAHNYIWNVDQQFVKQGNPGLVVAQYQATLEEFKGWLPVPNPLPLCSFKDNEIVKNTELTICYTPSGKHDHYPRSHRLYWHGKGYCSTMKILESLVKRYPIRLEVIRNKQVSHAASLEMKARSHILIDECVTGSYHRNSLEGLSQGCVVINAYGLLSELPNIMEQCSLADIPFEYATLDNLEEKLISLIVKGPKALFEIGERNRKWFLEKWSFDGQWNKFWEPVVSGMISRTSAKHNNNSISDVLPGAELLKEGVEPERKWLSFEVPNIKPGVSVVISHGGLERLEHLKTCICHLRKCPDINEIIVAESDTHSVCYEQLEEIADKAIFVKNRGYFQRGHALNVGSAIAEYSHILWLDNDLIVRPGFVRAAVKELERHKADVIVPYHSIVYLNEQSSHQVFSGKRKVSSLHGFKILRSGREVIGGATLLTRQFIQRYGGFEEKFEGWGGEDNAWHHKARIFGKMFASRNKKQLLYHLYHQNCGANDNGVSGIKSNPKYSDNLELLNKIKKIKTKSDYLRQFPIDKYAEPWGKDIEFQFVLLDNDLRLRGSVEALSKIFKNNFRNEIYVSKLDDVNTNTLSYKKTVLIFVTCSSVDENKVRRACELIGEKALAFELAYSTTRIKHPDLPVLYINGEGEHVRDSVLGIWSKSIIGYKQYSYYKFVQAVSFILGMPKPRRDFGYSLQNDVENLYPLWMYWEGVAPEWILECRSSIHKNADNVKLLNEATFEELREHDRDIKLQKLPIALKADYIRAYLLAHFGGFWLDSDCILLKNLGPLLCKLSDYEFIAHRERSGLVSNAFIGAPKNSRLARTYYQNICSVLRSGRSLGWTSLGSEPLSKLLNSEKDRWLELRCDSVQPVCWSTPEIYFELKEDSDHEKQFRQDTWCYMLSNEQIKKYAKHNKSASLMHNRSFFSFVIRKSMVDNSKLEVNPMLKDITQSRSGLMENVFQSKYNINLRSQEESVSGPGSTMGRTNAIRESLPKLFEEFSIKSIIDAPCGDFYWFKNIVTTLDSYTGIDIVPELINSNNEKYSSATINILQQDLCKKAPPEADLVFSRDLLVHLPINEVLNVLEGFIRSNARYLLMTTFLAYRENSDIKVGEWRPLNFLLEPFKFPQPLRIIYEQCNENDGFYADKCLGLWDLNELEIPAK